MEERKLLTVTCVGYKDKTIIKSFSGIHYTHVFHYILSGKGCYEAGGITYPLSAGQIFLVRRGDRVRYYPDSADPYAYKWIGFSGELAEPLIDSCAFSAKGLVINAGEGVENDFNVIYDKFSSYKQLGFQCCNPDLLGMFSRIISAYPSPENMNNDYATEAKDFILANLNDPDLKVGTVADHIGVSRSALFRVFTEKYGVSPMQYIVNQRMQAAKQLLAEGTSVKDAAAACGYDNPLYFSTVFKSINGMTPTEFRKIMM